MLITLSLGFLIYMIVFYFSVLSFSSCYLALGEVEEALQHFKKCLQPGSDVCVDRKIMVEASEGVQKAQVNLLIL